MLDEKEVQLIFKKRFAKVLYGCVPEELKSFDEAENKKQIENFCKECSKADEASYPNTFLYVKRAGNKDFVLTRDVAKASSGADKVLVLYKAGADPINESNASTNLLFNEMSKTNLDQMRRTMEAVFIPAFSTETNFRNWSRKSREDMIDKLSYMSVETKALEGQVIGNTELPLPIASYMNSLNPKDKKAIYEHIITKWKKLVKKVLKQDPESIFATDLRAGPLNEITFWGKRKDNLGYIYAQLNSKELVDVKNFLTTQSSHYIAPFDKLKEEVGHAKDEAEDNFKFLSTLQKYFDGLANYKQTITEVKDVFVPIMHLIMLIQNSSNHYKSNTNLVVLIRQICNEIITQSCKYLNGSELIQKIGDKELPEPLSRLHEIRDTCKRFKMVYKDYKDRSNGKWNIVHSALFDKLDRYIERCIDLEHVIETAQNYGSLELVTIGGTKGEKFTKDIKNIYKMFEETLKNFTNNVYKNKGEALEGKDYDVMDVYDRPTCEQFRDDFRDFKGAMKHIDKRVASVISQSFEDNTTFSARFKLFEMFDELIFRAKIEEEITSKYFRLLDSYKRDLKACHGIFIRGKQDIEAVSKRGEDEREPKFSAAMQPYPVPKNMSASSGAIRWADSVLDRFVPKYKNYEVLSEALKNSEEYQEVTKLFTAIQKKIEEYKESAKNEFHSFVKEHCKDKLQLQLLKYKDEHQNSIMVNFHPNLVRLLKEVKYFKQNSLDVPKEAIEIYDKADLYRDINWTLDEIVFMYNRIQKELHKVERPLLEANIKAMDVLLEPGIKTISWQQQNEITNFLKNSKKKVEPVYKQMLTMKANLFSIQTRLAKKVVIYERKQKSLRFEDLVQNLDSSYYIRKKEIEEELKKIHDDYLNTMKKVGANREDKEWREYIYFVNESIADGITSMVLFNLEKLYDMLYPEFKKDNPLEPLLEIDIKIDSFKLLFNLEFHPLTSGEDSIFGIVDKWIEKFVQISTFMDRADILMNKNTDYLQEVSENTAVRSWLARIYRRVKRTEDMVVDWKNECFKEFKELYSTDSSQAFNEFLDNAALYPTENELREEDKDIFAKDADKEGEEETETDAEQGESEQDKIYKMDYATSPYYSVRFIFGNGVRPREKTPKISEFKDKLTMLKNKKARKANLDSEYIKDFLKIKTSELLGNLDVVIESYLSNYQDFLFNNTDQLLSNIKEFIELTNKGVEKKPESGDKDLLYSVLRYIRDMKRVDKIVQCYKEHTKRSIQTLKKFDYKKMDDPTKSDDSSLDKYLDKIDNTYIEWARLGQDITRIETEINSLKKQESNKIMEETKKFKVRLYDFKSKYDKEAPFSWENEIDQDEITRAFNKVDELNETIKNFGEESERLNDLEELFNLQKTMFPEIEYCEKRLVTLKEIWDFTSYTNNLFENWQKQLFKKLVFDELILECATLDQYYKKQEQKYRDYKVYTRMQARVKTMNKTLELMSELQSDDMQDRHWKDLSDETKHEVKFEDPNFKFYDLYKLNLVQHAEKVSDIVEVAKNQTKIKKNLDKIKNFWEKEGFTWEEMQEKETFLLNQTDEIIDSVDQDIGNLQNMLGQKKYIAFFEQLANQLNTDLKTINELVSMFDKLQKNWIKLEPIFTQSADVKANLADTARRFDDMNAQFKTTIAEMRESPTVKDACVVEGRVERLKELLEILDICELELTAYLDQKKKKFPRFYFVSDKTLLTILSNSAKPGEVAKNLVDCFCGLKTIYFVPDPTTGEATKVSHTMESQDGETVSFARVKNYACVGEVEDWLRNLEAHMQAVLKAEVNYYYDDMGKEGEMRFEKWLDDKTSQLALLMDQVNWTTEVTKAFEELEEGNDEAMKKCLHAVKDKLGNMINKVIDGPMGLTENEWKALKTKTIAIITIQVHERDILEDLVKKNIKEINSFSWQSQLRFEFFDEDENEGKKSVNAKVADWTQEYKYEYLGNSERLVITPLTDRCYITLTQALSLIMGGAPQGPAGTGKTETTKDLGKGIGVPVYVFNCGKQMTGNSIGNLIKGLAQAGAWGCFDEFNTIRIEVLSIVAKQFLMCYDAIRAYVASGDSEFSFDEDRISIVTTMGFFITMNPGYKGRAELPESIKVQFRPCAMIKADFGLIAENMLMSEGFKEAKILSSRFVTLYGLSEELLSFQIHYDWRLRAMKSLLRQAGKLLRQATADTSEYKVLKSALKNFNLPRVITADKPIFEMMCEDLFPLLNVVHEHNRKFMDKAREILKDPKMIKEYNLDYRDENEFIKLTVQLTEILEVRHCMFVIGPAGSGKSAVIRTLGATWNALGDRTSLEYLNPKAITRFELYGYVDPKSGWKNGVLSSIMRNMSKDFGKYEKEEFVNKYMILDGDIDPEWIEAMNTVMDDNKVLTLASNERIPMTGPMRMLLEIQDMRNATPATASRGGCLCINETDINYLPYLNQWNHTLQKRILKRDGLDEFSEKEFKFKNPLDKDLLDFVKTQIELAYDSPWFKENMMEQYLMDIETVVPISRMAICQTITTILDSYYFDEKERKKMIEIKQGDKGDEMCKLAVHNLFYYAAAWAFGGITNDTIYLKEFDKNMRQKLENFPNGRDILDCFYDLGPNEWKWWGDEVPSNWENLGNLNFFQIIVPNLDVYKYRRVMELHYASDRSICMVGGTGTGKTTFVNYFVDFISKKREKEEKIGAVATTFNQYIQSGQLFNFVMGKMEKVRNGVYGAKGFNKIIYFIDDLNMAFADHYDTQSAIELLKQIIDYRYTYNLEDLEQLIQLQQFLFMASFNPKMGSGNISSRTQRFFTTLAISKPPNDTVTGIYKMILRDHFGKMDKKIASMADGCIEALNRVFQSFLANPRFSPTARKFFYVFNLRDVSRVVEGLLMTKPERFRGHPIDIAKCWLHELERVFKDRLFPEDYEGYFEVLKKVNEFDEFDRELLYGTPDEDGALPVNVFTSFIQQTISGEFVYQPVNWDQPQQLIKVLEQKLEDYNNAYPAMPIVLFRQAIEHICHISRIVQKPCGNALLLGVGGSGKQSLSRLSVFLHEIQYFQVMIKGNYNYVSFKEDIRMLFEKSAVKPAKPMALIITDGQIIKEQFLICINDFLNSGYIPELMAEDEYIKYALTLKNKAKSEGYPNETPDQLFKFLILQVRKNMKMILCMSPIGDQMRKRASKFPGIVNCCSTDFFHAWPREACQKVAYNFLKDVEFESDEIRNGVGNFMSEIHLSIDKYNFIYKEKYKRQCYTTPKSFLELIEFYLKILREKREKFGTDKDMYTQGYEKMDAINKEVIELNKMIEVEKAKADVMQSETKELLNVVSEEKAKANLIAEEAAKIAEDAKEVLDEATEKEANANVAFAEAIPAMEAANEAVADLDKKDIGEFAGYKECNPKCVDTCVAVNWILMPVNQSKKFKEWKYTQGIMKDPGKFKDSLLEVKDKIKDDPESYKERFDKIADIFEANKENPTFTLDGMKNVSKAAAGILKFVFNIYTFYQYVVKCKPLEEEKNTAAAKAEEATNKLNAAKAKKKDAEDTVAELEAKLKDAQDRLREVEEKCAKLEIKQDLATRLVDGLKDEYKRWKSNVENLGTVMSQVVGVNLISAGFISYLGPYDLKFREKIWLKDWIVQLQKSGVPYKEDIDPLMELVDSATMAEWAGQDLPDDRFSKENAAIIDKASRWPLIIDPQLQAAKYFLKKYTDLETSSFTEKKFENKLRACLAAGRVMIVENVQEELEPSIEPVLTRSFTKKNNKMFIKLGDSEIEYNPSFKLLMLSKLMNPHYKPEYAAMCTILNFIVTEEGLRDQLLANVVREERYELEEEKAQLVKRQNDYVKQLNEFEKNLLDSLNRANAETILDTDELVVQLEETKSNAKQIMEAQEKAKETEKVIEEQRKLYIPIADEGAMLYFLLITLCRVHPMYQYSLELFQDFFGKIYAMVETRDHKTRIPELKEMLRKVIYTMVSRGMFERHKLVFMSQITIRLMSKDRLRVKEEYDLKKVLYLLTGGSGLEKSQVDWMDDRSWNQVVKLAEIGGFEKLPDDLSKTYSMKFKEWWNEIAPEKERMPGEWKGLYQKFEEILIIRALRPDRINSIMSNWIAFQLGPGFTDCDGTLLQQDIVDDSYLDTDFKKPMMFVNAPGVDPNGMVKRIKNDLEVVPMGENMEKIAVQRIAEAKETGTSVMLEQIHLMVEWLPDLTKILEDISTGGGGSYVNPNFRLFLTTDPSEIIPIGIMERSILIIIEAPSGIKPNMKKAWAVFNSPKFDDKDGREKNILFALCYFHSMMFERKRYGRIGYNMNYPFNVGDLLSCGSILNKYLENLSGSNIPWDDLKYLFGEIMYGGHIVDDFDRFMCKAYLDYLMVDKVCDEYELCPYTNGKIFSFKVSQLNTYKAYEQHIEKGIKEESPVSIGMHPNTETASRIAFANEMFGFLLDILPLESGDANDDEEGGGGGGGTAQMIQEKVSFISEKIPGDKVNDYPGRQFEVNKITIDSKERKPFQNCFIQEFERINKLAETMTVGLLNLQLAQQGKVNFTEEIELTQNCMVFERIPEHWMKWSFPTMRSLTSWINIIKLRIDWLAEVFGALESIPRMIYLNKLYNPLGYINSIKQQTCQAEAKPLDEYDIITDSTTSTSEDILKTDKKPSLVMSFCCGMKIEGATFNWNEQSIEDCEPKVLYTEMPVLIVRSFNVNKPPNTSKMYRCPIYKTVNRSAAEYVSVAQLRSSKDHPDKWKCAGVALILDVEGFDN